MASGKTTVGRLLAARIGWTFVDLDEAIQERAGATAGTLIRTRGEAFFRELEADVTRELAGRSRMVMAPGGGWAARPELAEALGMGTFRIWLRVSPEEAVRRAEADAADRPLLGHPIGRRARVRELLARRTPSYADAEAVIDVDGKEPEVVVLEILRRLDLDSGG